ncbi:J domain-containing protein [Sphingomonas piscis]|uniref:J domain-containing protein n=1 Tax=Sphingomonas piscis TaxID=2714943 RepID=A0A6G7YRF0_9SPHN|nr:J domain-containing protein [Sphingomonas piscis]QIK79317.1 J domain-containing protein [Sphingomonas piscis]
MAKFRTHYDNLQVSRSASPEVIKAAYRVLSAKHHPDRNLGDPQAAEMMTSLNASYAVLTDEDARREHDRWIRRQETAGEERRAAAAVRTNLSAADPPLWSQPSPTAVRFSRDTRSVSGAVEAAMAPGRLRSVGTLIVAVLAGLMLVAALLSEQDAGRRAAERWRRAAAAPTLPQQPAIDLAAIRDRAPNGQPWPARADYVRGYPQLEEGGRSTLTIDNGPNSFPVYLKLSKRDAGDRIAVRHVYLPPRTSFAIRALAPGTYDVAYLNLNDGSIARSQPLDLTEVVEANGTRFSNVSLTLMPVTMGSGRSSPNLSDF